MVFKVVAKICSPAVIELLKNIPSSDGTIDDLEIMQLTLTTVLRSVKKVPGIA